jgi:transcription-repair coupling factor (superfamily II helicase)
LIEVGQLRAQCHHVGLRELVVTDGRARLSPVALKASQRMRVTRLVKSHTFDEESHILTISLPYSGRSTDDGGRNVQYLITFLQELFNEPN